ncbi:MAG: SseB family protein [Defluviimonas sp.]|uniref:SseB family protein n=1 Tax=Albidovulum sp. TaxID=1872424 RepID=UPI001DF2C6FD|nr:SseB family protein [Paracoccaceae bacterium]MCC0064646.1 SseB family protein [Defluviimonas sp.]
MTDKATPLDLAHAAMMAAEAEDAPRLRYFERLADCELFLLLAEDSDGTVIRPAVFRLEAGEVALAFDREDRLAAFIEGPTPYAALPGRIVARELAAGGLGLGLNLGVAPSAFLVPAEALGWLVATLGHEPERTQARPRAFHPPEDLPGGLVAALEDKLATLGGHAECALLAGVTYEDGSRGLMLAFVGASPDAEPALAKAVSESLVFSGLEPGALDVAFPTAPGALAAIGEVGRRFEMPAPEPEPAQVVGARAAPGMDPAKPPKLR